MTRNQTRPIQIGNVTVGGGAPVSVQTMGNVPTADIPAVLGQISRAAELGCDLFRVAVPDQQAADALKTLCAKSPLPLIADIHFDYR
ncbi:MAG: flavodoxin-dependent (E)-4-hydroxy-3-methylbut-2-enyl-diphosphate synthase, partial [Kiritimatiellae bacterium]|nr:flavodoxin-dependent (E)-4-hydroxy-3-methylbut-2-enyl-diphosphate synthase [Kiritimatiellia bacterium]